MTVPSSPSPTSTRRYDIDWLRVIAIFLLLFYHAAIVFQPWAQYIGFVQSPDYMLGLWKGMEALNIWRIPLLFFVSGMGLFFSMNRRSFKALLGERSLRILLPLVFGSLTVVPLFIFIVQHSEWQRLDYFPFPAHLWFLLNIYIYILAFAWLFMALRRYLSALNPDTLNKWAKNPLVIYLLVSPFILEALWVNPDIYSAFALSAHGFWIGMIAFSAGFAFVCLGDPLWKNLDRFKFLHLSIAITLFAIRSTTDIPNWVISIEALAWLLAVFGLGYRYLQLKHPALSYLNSAVFPVYIIHMIPLMGSAYFAVYWDIPVFLRFLFVLFCTLIFSFAFYEGVRRLRWVRPLFGLKY